MTETPIRVTRHFDFPAERVFDAWLDPARARRFFFATKDGEMIRADMEARVGGTFAFVDRRDGQDFAHTGTYIEIVRPVRLVFDFAVNDSPITRVTIEIEGDAHGCELTLIHESVPPEVFEQSKSGWGTFLANLQAALAD
jgi:uncharacterized protein YndB with AHSA1/START domain